jgi:hypothetical protein
MRTGERSKEIAACARASLGTESVSQSPRRSLTAYQKRIWPKEPFAIYCDVLFDSMPPSVNATALATAEVPQRLL